MTVHAVVADSVLLFSDSRTRNAGALKKFVIKRGADFLNASSNVLEVDVQ
jgi:hypothetical protein